MTFKVAFDNTHTSKQTYFAKITDRAQPRIVQNEWGWSINYFTDLRELLTVIRDAIRDHQTMHRRGTLHRNVSTGNILIRPSPSHSDNPDISLSELVSKTVGQLLVFNCAKHVEGRNDPRLDLQASSEPTREVICQLYNQDIAVHTLSLVSVSTSIFYVQEAAETNVLGSAPNGEWTSADLGWEDVGTVPDYASHTSIVNECTGTMPFISYKLIPRNIYPVHNAIHDLESFWWVIIYLCLTRESGGRHRRQNVPEKVQHLVDDLFHNSSARVCLTKALYFGEDGAVHFEGLLELFSDYFEPLKHMLTRWRSLLILGYDYRAYEFHLIHKYVLALIEDALGELSTKGTPVIRNELERREQQCMQLYNINHSHVHPGRSRSTINSARLNGFFSRPERTQVIAPSPPNSGCSGKRESAS